MRKELLANAQRIVVKVGSSMLTTPSGYLSPSKVGRVVDALVCLKREYGKEVVLVSSGAIACGMDVLNFKKRPHDLALLQAAAAVGQGKLIHTYEKAFAAEGFHVAQVLLTVEGMHERDRYLNARNTINALLDLNAIPIVNENDTVATEEIRFGDNDTLSAQVALMVDADVLIILSDVDGFCVREGNGMRVLHTIDSIDETLRQHVQKVKRGRTVGGMESKLNTGFKLMKLGMPLLIANGKKANILQKIIAGAEVGTLFVPHAKKQASKKRWLAFTANLPTAGSVHVDAGAYRALVRQGKSLLASGVTATDGHFHFGDAVKIVNHAKKEFAKGIVSFSRTDLETIKGCKNKEITALLGDAHPDEVVHRDNLIVLE